MVDVKRWITRRARKDRSLYEQYGKPLEQQHQGKYLAIGPKGDCLLGDDPAKLLQDAISEFGSGNFALAKVGYPTFGQWLAAAR